MLHSKQNFQPTWQAIGWRLLLTLLLLLLLLGFGVSIFNAVTTEPNAQVLPAFSPETAISR